MKPRSKLQKKVMSLSERLSPLSQYQRSQAIKLVAPHFAKIDSKGNYTCLDCGHQWRGSKAAFVICPNCKSKLEANTSRKKNFCQEEYFTIITTCKGFQVVRMFLLNTILRKGEKATHWFGEAFQYWIMPDGRSVIVGRARPFMPRYLDSWNWSSDMEIRAYHPGFSVYSTTVIGRLSVIPELRRNGFNGDFHGCSPQSLFIELLKNNKVETLWKCRQYELVRQHLASSCSLEHFWPSIRVALRHRYIVTDATIWLDLLRTLQSLDKDVRNPKMICPDNLMETHDEWVEKYLAHRERENARYERERQYAEENRYYSNVEQVIKDEAAYKQAKSRFLDLIFKDNELEVKPLENVAEFIEEGRKLHHCVFSNKYYNREDCLILHALVGGESVATIELNLRSLEIIQCRGKYNSIPSYKERIIALIQSHKAEIERRVIA